VWTPPSSNRHREYRYWTIYLPRTQDVRRARSESFPNAAEILWEIEFLTVNADFEPY